LTFSDLKKKVELSSPVLTKHLKSLSKEGLIQKTLSRDDRIVYQIISQKEVVGLLESLFTGFIFYIVGIHLSDETRDSIRRDLEKFVSNDDSSKKDLMELK
jgi:DNA-binding MarR family transcriptional regulator